jgi:hypothetical protein
MIRDLLNKLDHINESTTTSLIGWIDEYADGEVWLIKVPSALAMQFMLLANSIEDETVKGTEYEPGVGMMSKFHSQLGQTSDAPKWAPVVGDIPQEVQEELVSLRPITTKTIYKLKNVEGDISDYINEFLSDLSDAGLAMTTDSAATYTDSSMTKIRFDTAQ